MVPRRRSRALTRRTPLPVFLVVVFAALLVLGPVAQAGFQATPAATPAATPGAGPEASPVAEADTPVVLFAADGMRPDLVETYAADGTMPTVAGLLADGMSGDNGMLQAFPPNTGTGWHTLATGTWPSEHGSTNNTFHRGGAADFGASTSAYAPGILQADTLAQAAERAGETVVAVEWVGARSYDPPLQGPVVDFRTFFSDRGVLTNYDLPGQPAGAEAFGVSYQRVDLAPADEAWTNVPESFSPAMEQRLTLTNTAFPAETNADRFYDLYIYDSTDDGQTNYDRVLVAPGGYGGENAPPSTQVLKDGGSAVADLTAGEWADVKVSLFGERDGQTAGFYLKAIE